MSTLSSQGQELLYCLERDLVLGNEGWDVITEAIGEIDITAILTSPDQKS